MITIKKIKCVIGFYNDNAIIAIRETFLIFFLFCDDIKHVLLMLPPELINNQSNININNSRISSLNFLCQDFIPN